MKYFSALLLLIFFSAIAHAQSVHPGKLSGTIIDSTTNQALPYATVALQKGAEIIIGTTTDGQGAFVLTNLPLDDYTLVLSFVGYVSKKLSIHLSAENFSLDIDSVKLKMDQTTLSEVTVTGRKPLVEDKGDKLIYNAERDLSNAGGMAADVLRKVPMLSVDLNGNVQMQGNGNIKVLINGKPSALMARNLAEALRQMPAHTIKSIEVITSPGARYDAEGSAGVINIVTKKALQGFSGGINANVGNLGQGLGSTLMAKTKKVGLTMSASAYQYRSINENEFIRTTLLDGEPLHILTQHSTSDNTGRGAYGDLSFDYDPDSTSRINISASVWGGNFPNNSTLTNRLFNPEGKVLEEFTNNTRYLNSYRNSQLDLGYTKSFRKPEHAFSLLTQMNLTPNNYFYDTDWYSKENQITYQQRSTNYSHHKEYTIQTDYTYPFIIKSRKDTTSLKLEVGAKSILRDMGTKFRVEESLDGKSGFIQDLSQSNDLDYLQQVYAGYTSLQMSNRQKWNLNAGIRLEHTQITGNFGTTQTSLASHYNNLVPSIILSKSIHAHTLKASYHQRIQRPLIGYLNPWLNQSNPKNLSTGNPYLDPELSHALELTHSINTNRGLSLYSTFYWRFTNNAIEYVATVDTTGISRSQPQNIAQRKAYGLNLYLSGQIGSNWYFNGGGDLRYMNLSSTALNQYNSGIIWSVNLNSSYTLLNNYFLQANGSYNSRQINVQGTNSGFYWYGFSIRRQFWKKKASLTLNGNNIFNWGIRQTGKQFAPTFYADSRSLFINRSVQFTFDWRFGHLNAQNKKIKKIKNDDKSGQ